MGRVFVLGAGASRFAGYPLGVDLWPFIQKHKSIDAGHVGRDRAVIEAIAETERVLRGYGMDQHLEGLVTFLDLALTGADPLGLRRLDWKRVRPGLVGMIAHGFLWFEHCVQSEIVFNHRIIDLGVDPAAARAVMDAWVDRVRVGDTLISFNWDILHETALWRATKWDYVDGYGFAGPREGSRGASPALLLKLHGSVNWAQRDEWDEAPSIEHTRNFFLTEGDADQFRKGAGRPDEGRPLILPTYLKDLGANRLLLSLWDQAEEALIRADELTVLGYSLNAADSAARLLIGSCLNRNERLQEITVVAPREGASEWSRIGEVVGKRVRRKEQTFEEWVLT